MSAARIFFAGSLLGLLHLIGHCLAHVNTRILLFELLLYHVWKMRDGSWSSIFFDHLHQGHKIFVVICFGLVWLFPKEEQVLKRTPNRHILIVQGIVLTAIVAYHLQQLYGVIGHFGLLIPLRSTADVAEW
jgi:hypothetical protein